MKDAELLNIKSNCVEYAHKGAIVNSMSDNSIVYDIRKIIDSHFVLSTEEYCSWDRDKFSNFAVDVQDQINALEPQKKFLNSESGIVSAIIGSNQICHQSIAFFRVVRPEALTGIVEAPDFHRETFYSDSPETTKNMLNIWMPIQNICLENTMHYIPESHTIDDSELFIESQNELEKVKKFSSGHRLGFFWKPKKLIDGVDLSKAVPFGFSGAAGEYAAFSAMTIHGGARNLSNKLRFVIGFGLIAEEKIAENKDYFASGSQYFQKFTQPPAVKASAL